MIGNRPKVVDVIIAYTPTLAAIVSLLTGLGVMFGWVLDVQHLQSIASYLASMKFNTALLFFLCGLYLLLTHFKTNIPRQPIEIILVLVFFVALISLLQFVLGFDGGIDELFVVDRYTPRDAFPGRMSEGTALVFMLVSTAVLLRERRRQWAEIAAITGHLIALAAIFGYLFDVGALYEVFLFSTMALHTALTFALLTLGIIFSINGGLIVELLNGNDAGSRAMRSLMPMALLMPIIFGWLALQGVRNSWYSPSFAVVVIIVLTIMALSIRVIRYAQVVREAEQRQKQIQEQLFGSEFERIKLEKERELIEMREQFLAMLSHDMRNPLSTIIMSSDILATYDRRLDLQKRLTHLNRIRIQAHHILHLVEDIMLLSQMRYQSIPYDPLEGDLAAFCHETMKKFIELQDAELHTFVMNIPDEVIIHSFDKHLMDRVLKNLLRNSVKYAPRGGQISLTVTQDAATIFIQVKDTGIGIPQENQDKLFTMFQRASNVGGIPGYGLGLVIVKQIVDAHGGSIKVDSVVNQGTTFTIRLPVKMPSQLSVNA